MKNGDCFELIDGKNLEYKQDFIKEILQEHNQDKVIVVCVIGPQSSGKSTLMNFSFGTQFLASTGRCTQGVYFTLQQIPYEYQYNGKAKWLLLLDTEGLQSPERLDDEYDRKIVLFALMNSDLLIVNTKGDMSSSMTNILKICTINYDNMKGFQHPPQILYTFVQNDCQKIDNLKKQVHDLQTDVIRASQSDTIAETAEQLLGFNNDKIIVLGNAFKNDQIEQNEQKGIYENKQVKMYQKNFGIEASQIFQFVIKCLESERQFNQLGHWLDVSKQNWEHIDRHGAQLLQYSNLEDYQNDQKVAKKCLNFWDQYINEQNVIFKDKQECEKQSQKFFKLFEQHGNNFYQEQLNITMQKYTQKKNNDFDKYFIQKFNEWKIKPEQKNLKNKQQEKHIRIYQQQLNALISGFEFNLKNKLEQLKINMVSNKGLNDIPIRAGEIQQSQEFQNLTQQEKQGYIEQKFQIVWEDCQKQMVGEQQQNKIMDSYLKNLYNSFYILNCQIPKFELQDIEKYLKNQSQINLCQQQDFNNFLKQQIFEISDQQKKNQFIFDHKMFTMLKIPLQDRLFYKGKPEQFIKIRENFQFTLNFNFVCKNKLINFLNKTKLKDLLLQNLSLTEQKQISYKKWYNTYFNQCAYYIQYQTKYKDNKELICQNVQQIINSLNRAGFYLKNTNNTYYNGFLLHPEYKFSDLYQQKLKNNLIEKIKWVDYIIQNIDYNKNTFVTIDNIILNIFEPQQKSPQFQDFFEINSYLEDFFKENMVFNSIICPEISEKGRENKISQKEFDIIYHACNLNYSDDVIWEQLSSFVFKQCDWDQIIINIQELILNNLNYQNSNYNSDNSDDDNNNDKFNKENIIEINNLDIQQLKNFDQQFFKQELIEKLNYELHDKLALSISPQLQGVFYWIAMILCCSYQYLSVKKQLNSYQKYFQGQKSQQEKIFKDILLGETQEITQQSSKGLLQDSFNQYIKQNKQIINDYIMSEYLNNKEILQIFNHEKIYQKLDEQYIEMTKDNNNDFLEYVQNPVTIFDQFVEQQKQLHIDNKINQYIQDEIKENILNNLNLIKRRVNKIIQKFQQQNKQWQNQIGYFNIYDQNKQQILLDDGKYKVLQKISPVYKQILTQVLQGIYNGGDIQQKIKLNENEQILTFNVQYKSEDDYESNHIFTSLFNLEKEFDDKQQPGSEQNFNLLNLFIKKCQENFNNEQFKLLNFQQIFYALHDMIQQMINQVKNNFQKIINIDQLEVKQQIQQLINNAKGCKACCKFCNRKCQLEIHDPEKLHHNCQKFGHQLRVFAGGYNKGIKGNYPSLKTCDIIHPNTFININDKKFTWKEILQTQMLNWQCNYNPQDSNIKKYNQKMLQYWEKFGEQYCQKNNFLFIKKDDDVDENQLVKEQNMADTHQLFVIVLDESGSMKGQPWKDAIRGAVQLIEYLQKQYNKYQDSIQIKIYQYDNTCKLKTDSLLKNIDKKQIGQQFGGQGTNFNEAIKTSFRGIFQDVNNYDFVYWFFFTDGCGGYPRESLVEIENTIKLQINDLQINLKSKLVNFLITNVKNSPTLTQINIKLNELGKKYLNCRDDEFCQLKNNVPINQLGEEMVRCVESFKFD